MVFGKKKATKKAAKRVELDGPDVEEKVVEEAEEKAPQTMKDLEERTPAAEKAITKLVRPQRRSRHPYTKPK